MAHPSIDPRMSPENRPPQTPEFSVPPVQPVLQPPKEAAPVTHHQAPVPVELPAVLKEPTPETIVVPEAHVESPEEHADALELVYDKAGKNDDELVNLEQLM